MNSAAAVASGTDLTGGDKTAVGTVISTSMTLREGRREQPIARDISVARGLVDRESLLEALDRAVTRRITLISDGRRVALVSVDREEQDAQRFWSAVLDALTRASGVGRPADATRCGGWG